MATETGRDVVTELKPLHWKAGALAGMVGSAVMGVLILLMNASVLAVAIPSLYSLAPPPNVPLGLAVHLAHGAVLGVLFAGILSSLEVTSSGRVIGLGLVWGVVTWAVLAALLMPTWLSAVGSPASPPMPNFAPPSLLWHLVYGLVLSGVYLGLRDRL